MADFYAARAGTNAGAPLDGFLTALHMLPIFAVDGLRLIERLTLMLRAKPA